MRDKAQRTPRAFKATLCSGAETTRSWYRVRATSLGFLVAKDDFLLGVTSVSSTPARERVCANL